MTIAELPKLLTALGFNIQQVPATCGSVILTELIYHEYDRYWRLEFRWEDIQINVPAQALPDDVWDSIKPHALPGRNDVLILIYSHIVHWSPDTNWQEIESGARGQIERLTTEAEYIKKLVAPYVE